jgi:peroxiredoxin
VTIEYGRRSKASQAFLKEHGVTFTTLNDPDGKVFDAYGVRGTPTTIVIDPEGRLMFSHIGYGEGLEDEFVKEIETLLAWSGQEA